MAAATVHSDLQTKKRKSVTTCTFPPPICHEAMGPDAMSLAFFLVLSQHFHSPPSPSSRGSLVPPHFSHSSGIIHISEVVDVSPTYLDSGF